MNIKRIGIALLAGLLLAFTANAQDATPPPALPALPPVAPTAQLEPKKEGSIRIGVVTIKTTIKQDKTGQEMAEVIRNRWYSFLSGPTIELIPIDARIPQQINIEAGQKDCDFVLYSAVGQKTKGSLFGGFIKVAVPVLANAVPVGVGGTVATSTSQSIRNSVQEGAKDAAKNMANQAASKISAKDQVTLDYIFVKVNSSSPLLVKTLKGKAKADGEDIISPLIEQAAGQIVEAAMTTAVKG